MTRSSLLISINSAWNIYHFRAPLIRALQQAGFTVASAAPDDDYTERLRLCVSAHHALAIDSSGTSVRRDLLLFLRYLRLLRKTRPAALLTYTIKPNIYGALAARVLRIPAIANVSGLGTAFIRTSLTTTIVMRLYRLAFRNAACVFFQNPEDLALFVQRRLVPKATAKLLPGSGIDLQHFAPRAQPAHTSDAPAFLLIARILGDKGIHEFVAAARQVKQAYPHARFSLLGARGAANQSAIADSTLDQWIEEGIVSYLGHVEDVRDAITSHDCVVLPSYREGLPRSLLEAAAMEKPLIATNVPGCREIVRHGENGLLCKVRDADDLAQTMLDFIRMPIEQRHRMGTNSRRIAEQGYDQQLVFDAYIAELRALGL